jgi:hypothetical protein
MPLQQLYEPRLGLLYRYVTVLNQPFQPVDFGKDGVVFGLSLVKFRLAPLFLIFLVNHRGHSARKIATEVRIRKLKERGDVKASSH